MIIHDCIFHYHFVKLKAPGNSPFSIPKPDSRKMFPTPRAKSIGFRSTIVKWPPSQMATVATSNIITLAYN